jgi:hypothetical protein
VPARRRWFRLTPDRVVILLLAAEGLLLLSEWFGWFAFNKGHAVLIATADVAATILLLLLWFLAAVLLRLRFQLGVLSMLVLVVLAAIGCSWLVSELEQARKQRTVVEGIKRVGGLVYYDYEFDLSGKMARIATPPGPSWLRNLLRDDPFANVTQVWIYPGEGSRNSPSSNG